ncbi:MAG: type II toxin-antitoxin system RelE/ParE family toxin [Blastocatellales bacterium]
MPSEFHPDAKREFDEAVAYYDDQAEGLGDKFIEAVEETIRRIENFPEAWPLISPNTRRCRTSRFPYGVIYQFTPEDRIIVIAIMHLHREPDYWLKRVE